MGFVAEQSGCEPAVLLLAAKCRHLSTFLWLLGFSGRSVSHPCDCTPAASVLRAEGQVRAAGRQRWEGEAEEEEELVLTECFLCARHHSESRDSFNPEINSVTLSLLLSSFYR